MMGEALEQEFDGHLLKAVLAGPAIAKRGKLVLAVTWNNARSASRPWRPWSAAGRAVWGCGPAKDAVWWYGGRPLRAGGAEAAPRTR